MKQVLKIITGGLHLISRRGKVILILSTSANISLAVIDALALYLLAESFLPTPEASGDGLVTNLEIGVVSFVLALFVLRSVLATATQWFSITQMAREQTQIGLATFAQIVDARSFAVTDHESHSFNAVERGPEFLVMTLNNAAKFLSDVITAVVIFAMFLYLDALTAVLSAVYFAAVVVFQHKVLARRAARVGDEVVNLKNRVYQLLSDSSRLRTVLTPESSTSLRTSLSTALGHLSNAKALSLYWSYVPRYLLEFTFALGLGLVGSVLYFAYGTERTLASIVLFVGVGFRLMPTVNNIQGHALTMLAHASISQLALTNYQLKVQARSNVVPNVDYLLKLTDVCFRYSDSKDTDAVSAISLTIEQGRQYAIVGASGSGKTTLGSILAGLEYPTSGLIQKSETLRVAFVAQDTHLAYASLAENVALLWDRSQINFPLLSHSLELAGLTEMTNRISDPSPLLNNSVSGGEKQRIGLARAFYAQANLVVLDEITSSLDYKTENAIVTTLGKLREQITAIVIAHRLTTIKSADQIFLIRSGRLFSKGTFAELEARVPEFQEMISLGNI